MVNGPTTGLAEEVVPGKEEYKNAVTDQNSVFNSTRITAWGASGSLPPSHGWEVGRKGKYCIVPRSGKNTLMAETGGVSGNR